MDFKKHYDIDARVFDYFGQEQLSENERRRNYIVFKNFPVKQGEKILEIGSGRGWFSLEMAKLGHDITAVDLSQDNLDKISSQSARVKTIYGSADDLPFTEERFDWIVMNEVLEHLEKPKEVLEHIRSFLKPLGKVFISVPYDEKIVQELCIHCHQLTPRNAHLHSFSEESLTKLAKDSEYIVLRTFKYLSKIFTRTGLIKVVKFLPDSLFYVKDQISCELFRKPEYITIILQAKKKEI